MIRAFKDAALQLKSCSNPFLQNRRFSRVQTYEAQHLCNEALGPGSVNRRLAGIQVKGRASAKG
jgi:hypothetical protein